MTERTDNEIFGREHDRESLDGAAVSERGKTLLDPQGDPALASQLCAMAENAGRRDEYVVLDFQ